MLSGGRVQCLLGSSSIEASFSLYFLSRISRVYFHTKEENPKKKASSDCSEEKMALNMNLNFRTANTPAFRRILEEYENRNLLPANFPDGLSSTPFRVMTLQRTLLRKYLGLDFRRFDAITFDEISNSDRFILDRGAGLTLPALDELATIVDSVLVGDDQEEIITRVIQRMTSHVNGMMQRSLCPICQTLVENFTLQILVPCGHGVCSGCYAKMRANRPQRLDIGRRVQLNQYSTRSLGNGWAAIHYDEVVAHGEDCPICREAVRRNIQCFF